MMGCAGFHQATGPVGGRFEAKENSTRHTELEIFNGGKNFGRRPRSVHNKPISTKSGFCEGGQRRRIL